MPQTIVNKDTAIGKLIAVGLFPLTIALTQLAAWTMLQQGWNPASIIGICSALGFVVIATFEYLLPFRPEWNKNHGDILADILHNAFSSYASREIYKLVFIALLAPLVIALANAQGDSLWQQHVSSLPLLLQVFLVAALAEFGNYWVHRASHEIDFFWRFHSVHHSPLRLYWLNAGRDHPVSVLFFYLLASVPMILLGVPAEVLTLFYVLEAVHGLFQHCNIHLRLGPLNWIFSMAELHRWHHSKVISEANNNYGLTLIIWDVVFGTRYLPSLKGPEKIGVNYPEYPTRWSGHMKAPFMSKLFTESTPETENT